MTFGRALEVAALSVAALFAGWHWRRLRRRRKPDVETVALTAERRTMMLKAERRERGDRNS